MSEKFIKLFEQSNVTDNELWKHLCDCIGKTYKFTNSQDEVFYITVEYFRGYDRIGITHVSERGDTNTDEWDAEEFYEHIKDSVEIE